VNTFRLQCLIDSGLDPIHIKSGEHFEQTRGVSETCASKCSAC